MCYACTACFVISRAIMQWKGSVGLHWPVQRVDGKMAKELGERQLEEKMKEDGERAMREIPVPNRCGVADDSYFQRRLRCVSSRRSTQEKIRRGFGAALHVGAVDAVRVHRHQRSDWICR